MPALSLTATGFSVIDTYNFIREDMQTGAGDFDEEFDPLADQQGVPQFSFSSSSSSPSPAPSTTTLTPFPTELTAVGNGQQVTPAYTSPTPSPSPSYSPSPSPAPQSQGGSMYEMMDPQMQSLIDMEVNSSFLEELMGQPSPTPVPVRSPTPSTTPSPPLPPQSHTTTVLTSYVAEAAAAGCTVVETGVKDQQLLDVDVADLYDLDRHSFYDDVAMDAKVKDSGLDVDWMKPVPGQRESVQQQQQQLPVSPSLTELGPLAGSEQEHLLSAFDSLRRDILLDCKQLNISPNPKSWTAEDSKAWVTYMLDKCQCSDDCSASLAMPGSALCQKSRDELMWLSPSTGESLHEQLQLWMALADLPPLPSKPQQQQQQQQQSLVSLTPVPDLQVPAQVNATPLSRSPPSVSPAPSTDSNCSSQSSSLSSFSEAEMMFWCQESSEEDLFQDAGADLTPADQPLSTISSNTTSTSTTSPSSKRQTGGRPGKQIRLWEFLKELLRDQDPSMKWLDRTRGIFKIEDSNRVARLWGIRKNHPAMNYDKLSRSVRQYYKKGIIKKTTQTRRLVYQFCERYL